MTAPPLAAQPSPSRLLTLDFGLWTLDFRLGWAFAFLLAPLLPLAAFASSPDTHRRKHLLPRDEVQRAQHQPDLEQPFAHVVTQRPVLVAFRRFVGLLGLFLLLVLLRFVLLALLLEASACLLRRVSLGVHYRHQALANFHRVQLDAVRDRKS